MIIEEERNFNNNTDTDDLFSQTTQPFTPPAHSRAPGRRIAVGAADRGVWWCRCAAHPDVLQVRVYNVKWTLCKDRSQPWWPDRTDSVRMSIHRTGHPWCMAARTGAAASRRPHMRPTGVVCFRTKVKVRRKIQSKHFRCRCLSSIYSTTE